MNKLIYFWWIPDYKKFSLSGRAYNENMRYRPKQNYGVCEIADWLGSDLQNSIKLVNIWINNLTDL